MIWNKSSSVAQSFYMVTTWNGNKSCFFSFSSTFVSSFDPYFHTSRLFRPCPQWVWNVVTKPSRADLFININKPLILRRRYFMRFPANRDKTLVTYVIFREWSFVSWSIFRIVSPVISYRWTTSWVIKFGVIGYKCWVINFWVPRHLAFTECVKPHSVLVNNNAVSLMKVRHNGQSEFLVNFGPRY